MLSSVTDRLCCVSASCSSTLRRRRASASKVSIAVRSWRTEGILSAWGSSHHSATAVVTEIAAVMALAVACAP
jgi:hypothetical protein